MQKYNVPPKKYMIESVSRDKIVYEINTINHAAIIYLTSDTLSVISPTAVINWLNTHDHSRSSSKLIIIYAFLFV